MSATRTIQKCNILLDRSPHSDNLAELHNSAHLMSYPETPVNPDAFKTQMQDGTGQTVDLLPEGLIECIR